MSFGSSTSASLSLDTPITFLKYIFNVRALYGGVVQLPIRIARNRSFQTHKLRPEGRQTYRSKKKWVEANGAPLCTVSFAPSTSASLSLDAPITFFLSIFPLSVLCTVVSYSYQYV